MVPFPSGWKVTRSGMVNQRPGSVLYHVRETVCAIFIELGDAWSQTSEEGRGMNIVSFQFAEVNGGLRITLVIRS